MNNVHVRRVAPPERRKLRRWKRQRTNQVLSCRARVILLSSGRVGNREIAQRVGYTPQWVRIIIHRFNDGGMDGIAWYPYFHGIRSPTTFTADIVEQVAEVALSPPKELIGMTQWSLAKLRQYLVEQGILAKISLEWLRQLLRRRGVRWRRTKTWKESTDPEFWLKYRRIRRLYGKRPSGGRRLCVDEFGPLNLQPRHGHCWMGRGKRVERLRATYNRSGGIRHFLAFYDLESRKLYGRFTLTKTWRDFLSFLRWIRRRYPRDQRLYIVLDNYKTHLSADVLSWAKRNNICFYFTPTNASWLNRIECEFTPLKKYALDTSDYRNHEDQQAVIENYLRWRNGQRPITIKPWRKLSKRRPAA
jgi:transposase